MGLGGDSHLIIEWLKHTSGAKISHIPYKGFPEAMTSFRAGDVQMIALLVGNPDLARQVRDGEVKGLLLPGSTRSSLVPTVPTFAESGLLGDETAFTPWFGLFAPKALRLCSLRPSTPKSALSLQALNFVRSS
jgi:tripartite-type tricarboxylate transporter receptor subunit TctC